MQVLGIWWWILRRVVVCTIALTAALCLACGGDDNDGGGGSGPTDVPNGSRLGWNQAASSLQQLQSMTHRLYVDGAQMTLSDTTCSNQASSGRYSCSGLLPTLSPGRRVLELTSVLNGLESVRSEPLTITILATATTQFLPNESTRSERSDGDPASSSEHSAIVCIADSRECFNAQAVASGVRHPQWLSPTADGRQLFVEDGKAVRTIEDGILVAEPALVSPGTNGRIVGIAVDRSSNSGGAVFVAWTDLAADGPRLNITRYRELQNVLGEGATIVSGLPFPDDAVAPMAVDSTGLLYLAMPAADAARLRASDRIASDTGAILRFTRDGQVPAGNARMSPMVAEGYSRPTAMAIESASNRVWLAGDQPYWSSSLATFPVPMGASGPWPHRPQPALRMSGDGVRRQTPASLSVVRGPDTSEWLVLGSEGQLSRGTVTRNGGLEAMERLHFDPVMNAHSVAQGALDSWYVVTGADTASATILRLTRR
jgi:Glucose / Sorbosone dehydrogenase